ncbi:MAG: hypothetical protein IJZ53_13775 [Tyzzerella sp.]|nr:hypothetical protein [Tyzzerella sp.]
MDNIIIFDEKISTYYFYNNILRKSFEIYSLDRETPPILDMRKTQYITPSAVPVILSFGDYLRKLYKQPIELLIGSESSLLNFIICSQFKSISEKLQIFKIDKEIIESWNYKELRDLHKISYTNIHYTDVDRIKNPVKKRDYIYDCLVDKSKAVYGKILQDTHQLPINIIDATISSIAEIETNSIIYSNSYSFTYVASDKYGTNISIADSGVGFERSFIKEKRKLNMVEKYQKLGPKFHNYLVIMSVLNYSYEKHLKDKRADLWTLMTNVVKCNGIFKIQYGNTQVIFSQNSCKNCKRNEGKKDISSCVSCLLERQSEDSYSPIKLFGVGFQGVRIEIAVDKEED